MAENLKFIAWSKHTPVVIDEDGDRVAGRICDVRESDGFVCVQHYGADGPYTQWYDPRMVDSPTLDEQQAEIERLRRVNGTLQSRVEAEQSSNRALLAQLQEREDQSAKVAKWQREAELAQDALRKTEEKYNELEKLHRSLQEKVKSELTGEKIISDEPVHQMEVRTVTDNPLLPVDEELTDLINDGWSILQINVTSLAQVQSRPVRVVTMMRRKKEEKGDPNPPKKEEEKLQLVPALPVQVNGDTSTTVNLPEPFEGRNWNTVDIERRVAELVEG